MKIEQEIINRLSPVRGLLEQGKVILADRELNNIIEMLSIKLKK